MPYREAVLDRLRSALGPGMTLPGEAIGPALGAVGSGAYVRPGRP